MNLKEIIKYGKDKWYLVISFLAIFGITPAIVFNHVKNIQQEIKNIYTNNIVYNSAFRGLLDLEYTGNVIMENKNYDVEIRSCWTYDDFLNTLVKIEWVFVIHSDGDGHVAMYEAVYSPIHRTYHYVDMNMNFYHIKNLKVMEKSKDID